MKKESKVLLKWTNKFSQESGYVKSVSRKEGHFVNTYDEADARKFLNLTIAENTIKELEAMGEGENNVFEIVEI
ncbi:MAG: hypothetical protein II759_01465 [Lachnospiraceae bacterium]|nr:hypothetical protein [Lachnospiraceae bacterium]